MVLGPGRCAAPTANHQWAIITGSEPTVFTLDNSRLSRARVTGYRGSGTPYGRLRIPAPPCLPPRPLEPARRRVWQLCCHGRFSRDPERGRTLHRLGRVRPRVQRHYSRLVRGSGMGFGWLPVHASEHEVFRHFNLSESPFFKTRKNCPPANSESRGNNPRLNGTATP
jgi:hypothetical protein